VEDIVDEKQFLVDYFNRYRQSMAISVFLNL